MDHTGFKPILDSLAADGMSVLLELDDAIADYCDELASTDPETLSRTEALAFWLNLYNAGALRVASRALRAGYDSVLRVPGGFDTVFVDVAGERLTLDDIEHGKLRRFKDPRIHAALICGSVSCPTLRSVPYSGIGLNQELDDQMRSFLSGGAVVVDHQRGVMQLSRVFGWYGGDFTRPHRMPTWLPPPRHRLVAALRPWLPPDAAAWTGHFRVEFQTYDWGLRCAVE